MSYINQTVNKDFPIIVSNTSRIEKVIDYCKISILVVQREPVSYTSYLYTKEADMVADFQKLSQDLKSDASIQIN